MVLRKQSCDSTFRAINLDILDGRDLSCYEFVCFDLFDTIVGRTVHPEDVKRMVCERLARTTAIGVSGEALYQIRSEVERELCSRNKVLGFDMEFSLDEALREIWNRLPSPVSIPIDSFQRMGIELEVATECSVIYVDPDIKDLLEIIGHFPIKLCLVSDFYLSSINLKRILRYHDLEKYFQHLFVSADRLLTKRSGRQYDILLGALDVTPEKVLMIGDNVESDYRRSMEYGINAIHINREFRYSQYADWRMESASESDIDQAIDNVLMESKSEVFKELALTLFSFTELLYDALLAKGIRDVFFLAREGQLLKRLFDSYQSRRHPTRHITIRSHYLEVSRRSTFLPSLGPLDKEDFETLFRQYRRISIEEFLLSLGLDFLLDKLESDLGLDMKERFEDLPSSPEFAALLANVAFRDAYDRCRLGRRAAFLSYLQTFPMLGRSETLCLVDVGWKGTIQDNLFNLLQQSEVSTIRELDGFYLGLIAPGGIGPTNRKQGLLFSNIEGNSEYFSIFNENRALFEVMLAADHGSAAEYELVESGKPEVIRSEFSEEPLFNGRIKPAQDTLEACFHKLDALLHSRIYSSLWLLNATARRHARMVFNPLDNEISWFTGVYHMENFGVFEQSQFCIAYQRGI